MMIKRGSLHSSQYFEMVTNSLMPFINIAPSPTVAMTARSGKANLAEMAYGTPGPMVARFPESDAIIPRRTLRSRANQLAAEPESATIMQLSGNRGDSSQNTRSEEHTSELQSR